MAGKPEASYQNRGARKSNMDASSPPVPLPKLPRERKPLAPPLSSASCLYVPDADDRANFAALYELRLATVPQSLLLYGREYSATSERLRRLRGPSAQAEAEARYAERAAKARAAGKPLPERPKPAAAVAYLEAAEIEVHRGGTPLIYAVLQPACNLLPGKPPAHHPLAELRRTPERLAHYLAVSWFAVCYMRGLPSQLAAGWSVAWEGERRSYAELRPGERGKRTYYLGPDGVVVFISPSGRRYCGFVEIDLSTERESHWREKIARYFYYAAHPELWTARYGSRFPTLLIVTRSAPKAAEIAAWIARFAAATKHAPALEIWIAVQTDVAIDETEIAAQPVARPLLPDPSVRINAAAWQQVRLARSGGALYPDLWRLSDILDGHQPTPATVAAEAAAHKADQERKARDLAARRQQEQEDARRKDELRLQAAAAAECKLRDKQDADRKRRAAAELQAAIDDLVRRAQEEEARYRRSWRGRIATARAGLATAVEFIREFLRWAAGWPRPVWGTIVGLTVSGTAVLIWLAFCLSLSPSLAEVMDRYSDYTGIWQWIHITESPQSWALVVSPVVLVSLVRFALHIRQHWCEL